jgi:ABC-type nickel/cobalt efflux system permease component RcnA
VPSFRRTLRLACLFLPVLLPSLDARGHDIPNQRVDRSIQVTVRPGLLEVDYEVSLTELTLTQDLRALIGTLPGADRQEWLSQYAEVTGPLNARGLLVSCEGKPLDLAVHGHDLVVEEHPRYTFHFRAPLPARGRILFQDTNYVSSEGTSRLAVRGQGGAEVDADDLPGDVDEIAIRPVWQLSDEEEARTKKIDFAFRGPAPVATAPVVSTQAQPEKALPTKAGEPDAPRATGLSSLLDRGRRLSLLAVALIAIGLGAVHAVQPGHGKTIVSAIALGPGARWYHPTILGLATTLAHTGSVLLIAAALWWTGASRVADLHRGLTQAAGFAIAAGGFWRIGRYLGQWNDAEPGASPAHQEFSLAGLIGLGLAGGLVPCWDAVGLVVLAAAIGRLGTGVLVVIAFGAGMAAVLVGVGLLASRLRSRMPQSGAWEPLLNALSGVLLAAIGLVFFLGV